MSEHNDDLYNQKEWKSSTGAETHVNNKLIVL